jgi:hypothetical protein
LNVPAVQARFPPPKWFSPRFGRPLPPSRGRLDHATVEILIETRRHLMLDEMRDFPVLLLMFLPAPFPVINMTERLNVF